MRSRTRYAIAAALAVCLFGAIGTVAPHDFMGALRRGAASSDVSFDMGGEEGASAGRTIRQTFVIPLQNQEKEHHVRMSVVIEVDASDLEEVTKLVENKSKLRDAFISKVIDCKAGEMRGRRGLDRTKRMMRAALREANPDLGVRGVYLSEYVVE